MNILGKILLGGLLLWSPGVNAFSQTVVGDSCIVLTPSEARTITKMTEDLKYTKKELQLCDSIGERKSKIIDAQKSIIVQKDKIIATEKKKAKKTGLFAGGLSFILGLIIGGLAL